MTNINNFWIILGNFWRTYKIPIIDFWHTRPLSVFIFPFSVFIFQFSFQSQVSKGCETLFERKFQFHLYADYVPVITPQSTFGRAKTRCVCCKTSARIGARSIYFSNFVAFFGKNLSITTLNTKNTKLFTPPKHEKTTNLFLLNQNTNNKLKNYQYYEKTFSTHPRFFAFLSS